MTLDEFLIRNRLDASTWEKANIPWEVLQAIAEDHISQADRLRDAAEMFAREVQRFNGVHSVRWRVKDVEHLQVKIVRKRAEGKAKYADISAANYFEIVTDLVGLRALHLFKDDCFSIDSDLRGVWNPIEQPIAYVRVGDPSGRFEEKGFDVKPHSDGYRSIHYVFSTQPLNRKVSAEIQVRTIFEEGWSEIDHRVRYPNFSNNTLVGYFLTIFNRLAGSADEMGTFVQGLTSELSGLEARINDAQSERESALTAMGKMLSELETHKKQDVEMNKKLVALQTELSKLRRIPDFDGIMKFDPGPTMAASLAALEANNKLDNLAAFVGLQESLGKMSALATLGESLKFGRGAGTSVIAHAAAEARTPSVWDLDKSE